MDDSEKTGLIIDKLLSVVSELLPDDDWEIVIVPFSIYENHDTNFDALFTIINIPEELKREISERYESIFINLKESENEQKKDLATEFVRNLLNRLLDYKTS